MGGAIMAQLGEHLVYCGRYAQKALVLRGVPFPVLVQ